MNLFKFKKRNTESERSIDDVLLSAILSQESISCEQALNIPAVARVRDRTGHVALKLEQNLNLIGRAICKMREIEFWGYLC